MCRVAGLGGEPGGAVFLPLSLGDAPDLSWNQLELLGVNWDRQAGVGWRVRGLGDAFGEAPLLSGTRCRASGALGWPF